jgi:hypothetical protein
MPKRVARRLYFSRSALFVYKRTSSSRDIGSVDTSPSSSKRFWSNLRPFRLGFRVLSTEYMGTAAFLSIWMSTGTVQLPQPFEFLVATTRNRRNKMLAFCCQWSLVNDGPSLSSSHKVVHSGFLLLQVTQRQSGIVFVQSYHPTKHD